ncbi:MAG: prepilin-type N-terminal cleavage/methylation domain-containing protein [Candidatus Omnitrophota bacterium]
MKKQGFTLAEIMVAVAVLGVVMAIVIPSMIQIARSAHTKICIKNLKRVEEAKALWAMDYSMGGEDTPAWSDLVTAYVKSRPRCPNGGTYTIGNMNTKSTCSITGHVLP